MEAQKSGRCLLPSCLRKMVVTPKRETEKEQLLKLTHLKTISPSPPPPPAHMNTQILTWSRLSPHLPNNNLLQSPLGLSEREK